MISSYRFSQEHNFQSILWDAIGATVAIVRRGAVLCAALYACLPAFVAGCAILAKALGLVALCVAGVVAVAMVPVAFWAGLALVAVGAYVTFPRSSKAVVNG